MDLKQIVNFVKTDIWRMRLRDFSGPKQFLIRNLRIIILSVRGFAEDKCKFRASALTFFSLLSIVPVFAMMFGIAKGFGYEKTVSEQILVQFQGQGEVVKKMIEFANSMLDNAKGGLVAGIGVAMIFWTVIKVLSNIESSFNDIWGIKSSRSIGRKFSDYLSVMLICPILLVMSTSLTVAISGQVRAIIEGYEMFSAIGPFVFFLLKFSNYVTIWVVFSFILIFMPNTKVNFRSGILAGVIAGTIFLLAQGLYIYFQIGVSKYSAIYAGFASLPLFLIWLQISWLIVLFGAELAFAHQNVDTYEFEPDCLNVSHSYKLLLSLLLTEMMIRNFCKGKKAFSATEISHKLEVPIRLVRQVLFELVESGVIGKQMQESSKDVLYQPAIDVDLLTVKYVKDALENTGSVGLPLTEVDEFNRLCGCMGAFDTAIGRLPENVLLKDMALKGQS
ncbi:MAG: YihY/virulence factor BrkB family protein [Planctomycetes bacterium]|nr:YihY/virulence factor BrkB family protein [Planctomycetota bacterium]